MRKKNLIGKQFHKLTVIGESEPVVEQGKPIKYQWVVRCECGNTKIVPHQSILQEKVKSCGCDSARKPSKYNPGDRYAMLTIVEEGPRSNRNKRQVWCSCDCGNPQLTLVQTNNLVSGNTSSCGCVGEESRKTHGLSNTRTYQIHEGMLRRCKPELAEQFPYHAGKGIKVCADWNPKLGGSFENFYRDMGEAPEGMSLDRIDVNGDYCKENCRWASNSIQGYNKGLDPNNTSGKSGVSFYTSQGKWSAEIHVDSEHIRLGMFVNFEDAVKAREEAELKYYGWNKQ